MGEANRGASSQSSTGRDICIKCFFVGACGALPYGLHVYGHRLGIGVDLNDGDLGAVGVGVFVECDEPRSLSLKELNQPRDTDTLSIDGARCPA
ncbi:MAG: hypothetical protein QOH07_64 [Mycobacterium sp.]|nr:hypothetical protein [Mycobacterium sp.]